MPTFRDRDGNTITEQEWTQRSNDPSYIHVAATVIRDGRKRRVVHTHWLGFNPMNTLDHKPGPERIYVTKLRRGSSREAFTHYFRVDAEAARERHDIAVAEMAAELDNPTVTHLDALAAFMM